MFEYNPDLPAVFYRFEDGSTGAMQAEGAELFIPEGATQISYEEWQADQDALKAAREAREAAEAAEREAALKSAYLELRALGLSDAAARAISGYTGPA